MIIIIISQKNVGLITLLNIYLLCYVVYKSVPPGFCDSAIAEFIAKSSKLRNFCKSVQIFRRFWA